MRGRSFDDRARLTRAACASELLLLVAATVLVSLLGSSTAPLQAAAVAILAVATGTQNAVVRRLAVPDLTTTVLTMTLTGIAADLRGGRLNAAFVRRLLAVASMLAGAIGGAEVIEHAGTAPALAAATTLLGAVTICAHLATRHDRARHASQPAAGSRTGPQNTREPAAPDQHGHDPE